MTEFWAACQRMLETYIYVHLEDVIDIKSIENQRPQTALNFGGSFGSSFGKEIGILDSRKPSFQKFTIPFKCLVHITMLLLWHMRVALAVEMRV